MITLEWLEKAERLEWLLAKAEAKLFYGIELPEGEEENG